MTTTSEHSKYTVGWLCALPTESAAAEAFLDEEHTAPLASLSEHDNNFYTRGRMGRHNVVIAILPKWEYGTSAAAAVAKDMMHTFPNIKIGLLVGVGGGAPSSKADIRLGDIVVGSRGGGAGGVIQYDYGQRIQDKDFAETGHLNQPPQALLIAVAAVETKHMRKGHQLNESVAKALDRWPRLARTHSRPTHDVLYKSTFKHDSTSSGGCETLCGTDDSVIVQRRERSSLDDDPTIHHGLIASGNSLIKDAKLRDKLAIEQDILCFEMEAAGVANHFPCLNVRGICDYADTHKNQAWQGHAAMMAAAYTRELLDHLSPKSVDMEDTLMNAIKSIETKQNEHNQALHENSAIITQLSYDHQLSDFQRWLSPSHPSVDADRARSLRHEGTGLWVFDCPAFKQWDIGSLPCLWIHGLPGNGKTVLSTTIVDYLALKKDEIVLQFFFDFRDAKKRTLHDMLCSLVLQAYTKGCDDTLSFNELLKNHESGLHPPSTEDLSKYFQDILVSQPNQKINILVDALDECSTRTQLIEWITTTLVDLDPAYVKFIATSRPEPDFARIFGTDCSLPLSTESVNADIRSYVQGRLKQDPKFNKWWAKPEHQSMLRQISDEVGDKADGMFRWATCQLDSLAECMDRGEVEHALKTLPSNLHETYKRALRKIPQERKAKATRLLQFLVHSKHPLTVAEAVDVVAMRPEGFDPENRLPCAHDILQLCPSMLSIVRTNVLTLRTGKNGAPISVEGEELHLAHLSVREFLIKYQRCFQEPEASIAITNTCLGYLRSISGAQIANVDSLLPLAKHAAVFWMNYAVPAEDSPAIAKACADFLLDEQTYKVWSSLYHTDSDGKPIAEGTKPVSSLYFACNNGLEAVARELLSRPVDFIGQDHHAVNLTEAIAKEYHGIVETLLSRAASLDAAIKWQYLGDGLIEACQCGFHHMAQLLIDAGADANFENLDFRSPLLIASEKADLKMMQILLDEGANPNLSKVCGLPLVVAAACKERGEVVRKLLEHNADINAMECVNCNQLAGLQAAGERGHTDVVRLLADHKAAGNNTGETYGPDMHSGGDKRLSHTRYTVRRGKMDGVHHFRHPERVPSMPIRVHNSVTGAVNRAKTSKVCSW